MNHQLRVSARVLIYKVKVLLLTVYQAILAKSCLAPYCSCL